MPHTRADMTKSHSLPAKRPMGLDIVEDPADNSTTPGSTPMIRPTPLIGNWADYGWEEFCNSATPGSHKPQTAQFASDDQDEVGDFKHSVESTPILVRQSTARFESSDGPSVSDSSVDSSRNGSGNVGVGHPDVVPIASSSIASLAPQPTEPSPKPDQLIYSTTQRPHVLHADAAPWYSRPSEAHNPYQFVPWSMDSSYDVAQYGVPQAPYGRCSYDTYTEQTAPPQHVCMHPPPLLRGPVSRFPVPPPPTAKVAQMLRDEHAPPEEFVRLVHRWFSRAVASQASHPNVTPCPSLENCSRGFFVWVGLLDSWWQANYSSLHTATLIRLNPARRGRGRARGSAPPTAPPRVGA